MSNKLSQNQTTASMSIPEFKTDPVHDHESLYVPPENTAILFGKETIVIHGQSIQRYIIELLCE